VEKAVEELTRHFLPERKPLDAKIPSSFVEQDDIRVGRSNAIRRVQVRQPWRQASGASHLSITRAMLLD
jgi:hypothetical protein